jgi:hypothetical protein
MMALLNIMVDAVSDVVTTKYNDNNEADDNNDKN